MPLILPTGPIEFMMSDIEKAQDGTFTAKYAIDNTRSHPLKVIEWTRSQPFSDATSAIAWLGAIAEEKGVTHHQKYNDDGTVDFEAMSKFGDDFMSTMQDAVNELMDRTHSQIALFHASLIDALLTKLLQRSMVVLTKEMHNRIFKGYGPLSSFSAKIDLCFAFNLIDESIYRELNILKKIRNLFAHPDGAPNFERQDIKALCQRFSQYSDKQDGVANYRMAAENIMLAFRPR